MAEGNDEDVTLSFGDATVSRRGSFIQQLENNIKAAAPTAGLSVAEFYQKAAYTDLLSTTVDPQPEKSIKLPRLVRYADSPAHEDDHPVFLIDVLIYVQGVELSEYVQGTVRIAKNTIQGVTSATFVLDNASDRFVWSEANLRGMFGYSNPDVQRRIQRLATSGDQTLLDEIQNLQRPHFTANERVKKAFYDYKADPVRNPRVRDAKNTPQFARFKIGPNRTIFNKFDPIRIFSLYPFRVPGTGNVIELWMPEFTGYVKNASIDDDEFSGKSMVTIEATDIVDSFLRRMRIGTDISLGIANPLDAVGFRPLNLALAGEANDPSNQAANTAVNPATRLIQQQVLEESDRFFNPQQTQFYDDVVASKFGQAFYPNLPMEEAVKQLLVFNPSNLESGAGNRGVRAIEYGGSFFYDPTQTRASAQNFLSQWHKFCLFGAKRRPWTRTEVEDVGSATTTDGVYSPNAVRLWFLLPADGTGPKNVADQSTISIPIAHEVNWSNRANVLRNLVESIDYRMFVGPTGDLICEFPMADFRPEDFGEFKDVFRINKAATQTSIGDEQEDPAAGMIVTTGFAQGRAKPENDNQGAAEAAFQTVFVFAPYIAAQYGIDVDQLQIPFLLASEKAIAQQRAVIEFQKRNARCNAMSFNCTYRPFILPNRPLHHLRRTRMGLTVSVDVDFELGKVPRAHMSTGLEHVRAWTGYYRQPDDFTKLLAPQREEIALSGVRSAEDMQGIDPLTSADEIELQVFTNIMAGESLPTSARLGWGVDENGTVVAPASGVYILDPQAIQKELVASAETAHEEERENIGATAAPVTTTETPSNSDKVRFDPLASMTLKSPFGDRNNPTPPPGGSLFHKGVDYIAATGTELRAPDDGTVVQVQRLHALNGNSIKMRTNTGLEFFFLHLDETLVSVGDSVTGGQVIGRTGNTGRSTGPHLHVQMRKEGSSQEVDPDPVFPYRAGRS